MKLGMTAAILGSLALLAAAPAANASVMWTWSLSSSAGSGSGQLVTTDESGGLYEITSMTGTWTPTGDATAVIEDVLAPGGFAGNDNELTLAAPQLSEFGVSFSLVGGGNVNVFFGSSYTVVLPDLDGPAATNAEFIASVPEPISMLVLGAGLAGLGWARRRRA